MIFTTHFPIQMVLVKSIASPRVPGAKEVMAMASEKVRKPDLSEIENR